MHEWQQWLCEVAISVNVRVFDAVSDNVRVFESVVQDARLYKLRCSGNRCQHDRNEEAHQETAEKVAVCGADTGRMC